MYSGVYLKRASLTIWHLLKTKSQGLPSQPPAAQRVPLHQAPLLSLVNKLKEEFDQDRSEHKGIIACHGNHTARTMQSKGRPAKEAPFRQNLIPERELHHAEVFTCFAATNTVHQAHTHAHACAHMEQQSHSPSLCAVRTDVFYSIPVLPTFLFYP